MDSEIFGIVIRRVGRMQDFLMWLWVSMSTSTTTSIYNAEAGSIM